MRYSSLQLTVALCALSTGVGLAAVACSSDQRPAPGFVVDSAGAGGASNGAAGGNGAGGVSSGTAGGSDANGGQREDGGAADDTPAGAPGSGGEGGDSVAGAANAGESSVPPGGPFTGNDPFPCSSDDASPPSISAICDPTASWGTGAPVASGASPGGRLVGVTPDLLTLVWSEGVSSETWYYFVDRSVAGAAFGDKARLLANNVLALSPDGLRVVTLADDQSTLFAVTRANRDSAFGPGSEGEFALLNAQAQVSSATFSSCAFAPDDHTLYYTLGSVDERYPLHVSTRSGTEPWPVGQAIESCEFEQHAGYPRYPTAVSADGKTLFFYDSWRGKARAGWRETASGPFTWFKDLGDVFVPQPDAACDRLFYSVADPASSILSAPVQ